MLLGTKRCAGYHIMQLPSPLHSGLLRVLSTHERTHSSVYTLTSSFKILNWDSFSFVIRRSWGLVGRCCYGSEALGKTRCTSRRISNLFHILSCE